MGKGKRRSQQAIGAQTPPLPAPEAPQLPDEPNGPSNEDKIKSVEALLKKSDDAFQKAEAVKSFLLILLADLMQLDPSYAKRMGTSDEEIKRLYGCYKISGRVKSQSSILNNFKRQLRSPQNQTDVENLFGRAKKATPLSLEEVTSQISDLIGVRIVCYSQRQKNRVFQLIHRLTNSTEAGQFILSSECLAQLTKISGDKLSARLGSLGASHFRICRENSKAWKYFNPQPQFLESSDLVGLTAESLGLASAASEPIENQPKQVLLGRKDPKDIPDHTLKIMAKRDKGRWPFFAFQSPHELLGKILENLLEDCDLTIHGAFLDHVATHRTQETLGYEITYSDEGYSSVQTTLVLNIGTTSGDKLSDLKEGGAFKFEIQIRSLLEDAFSEPEHSVVYKGALSLSAKNTSKTLGSELDSADDTLQALFDHRDIEATPKSDFFIIQQSSVLPDHVQDPTLRRDFRRTQWLHRDRLHYHAFLHAAKMRLQCRSYDVGETPDVKSESLEYASLYAAVMAEQCVSLLFLAYLHNDKRLMESCNLAYSKLGAIFDAITKAKVEVVANADTSRERSLWFITVFRRSLISYLLNRQEDANKLAIEAVTLVEEIGQEKLSNQLGKDIYHYAFAWLSATSTWANKPVKSDCINKLNESSKEESWVGLWATNTICYNGLGDEDPQKRFTRLESKILAGTTKPLGRLLQALQSQSDKPLETLFRELRPYFREYHVGHLKVLDSLVVLNPQVRYAPVLYDLIKERMRFLVFHGFVSENESFLKNLQKSLHERHLELVSPTAVKVSTSQADTLESPTIGSIEQPNT